MKKMITAILCGILLFAASCFAADTPKEDLLYPIKIDGKWRYFDLTGKMVIAPNSQFDEAMMGPFEEGFGMVVINEKYGFIDKTGKIIIAPQFDWAAGFSGGVSRVQIGEKWSYINKTGKILIEPREHDDLCDFSEGMFCAKIDGKWGFYDDNGTLVIKSEFDYAGAFSEGLARVAIRPRKEGKYGWGYIDKSGKFIIEPKFRLASDFSDGLAQVNFSWRAYSSRAYLESEQYDGYIDRAGKIVIVTKPRFDDTRNFSYGLAAVKIGEKYGLIDKTGKMLTESKFDEISGISRKAVVVKIGEKYGLIDHSGKAITETEFERIDVFSSEGLFVFEVGKKWGILDSDGKQIFAPQSDEIDRDYYHEIAILKIDGKNCFIDKNGNLLYTFDLAKLQIDGAKTPNALYILGFQYEQKNDAEAAKAAYDALLSRFPDSDVAVKATERLLALSGNSNPSSSSQPEPAPTERPTLNEDENPLANCPFSITTIEERRDRLITASNRLLKAPFNAMAQMQARKPVGEAQISVKEVINTYGCQKAETLYFQKALSLGDSAISHSDYMLEEIRKSLEDINESFRKSLENL